MTWSFGDRAWTCAAWATVMIIHSSVSFTQPGDAWKTRMDVEVGLTFEEFTVW